MKRQFKYIICLLSLLLPSVLFGQNQKVITDSKTTFLISGNLEKENNEGQLTIDLIEVKDVRSKKIIQTIKPDSKFINQNKDELFEILDINYDGNNDFIVLSANGQYNDVIYDFYLCDTNSKKFIKWEKEFNNGENQINVRPLFDTVSRTIKTYWHNTATFQKESTFEFSNGDYQLIEEYNQELDKESDYRYVIITYKKIIEGKLRLVDLEMIPLKDEH